MKWQILKRKLCISLTFSIIVTGMLGGTVYAADGRVVQAEEKRHTEGKNESISQNNEDIEIGQSLKIETDSKTVEENTVQNNVIASGQCGMGTTYTLDNEGKLIISGCGSIANNAFDNHYFKDSSAIKTVIIETGIEFIGMFAFGWCKNLTEIEIPESVTKLSNGTFYGCESLVQINLPSDIDIDIIGNSDISEVFGGCINLENVEVSKNNQKYASIDGCLYSKDLTKIFFCPAKKSEVVIAETVTSIDNSTFKASGNLRSVTIPDTVIEIGQYAFSECEKLESVKMSSHLSKMGVCAFECCRNLKCIDLPEGLSNIPRYAFSNCDSLNNVIIPETVTEIEYGAFQNCQSLKDIIIPISVVKMGDHVFENCGNLKSMEIKGKIHNLGAYAFSSCRKLVSIKMPEGLASIGNNAFEYCSGLSSISIPKSVTEIGDNVFDNCENLKKIKLFNVTKIGENALRGCAYNKRLYCPMDSMAQRYAELNYIPYFFIDSNGQVIKESIEVVKNSGAVAIGGNSYNGKPQKVGLIGMVFERSSVILDLEQNIDYVVSYKNNINAGRAAVVVEGIGDFTGKIELPFTIETENMEGAHIELANKNCIYTGREQKPEIKSVKIGNRVLTAGIDYTVSYRDNKNPGTATVIVKGKGNYVGSAEVTFKIQLKISKVSGLKQAANSSNSLKLSWKKISKASGYQIYRYDNKRKKYVKAADIKKGSSVIFTDKKLKPASSYKYKVRAYRTIEEENYYGNYSDVVTMTTKPETVKFSKATSSKKQQAKLIWKKTTGVRGYEVYCSNKKKGKYIKAAVIKSGKTTSWTNKKLKSKKTYYYKVRAYKIVGKTKIYGGFSKTMGVRIK